MAPRTKGGKISPIFARGAKVQAVKVTGSGRNGLKRHQRSLKNGNNAVCKPALRRVARRAGVKRINLGIYEEANVALRAFLSKVVKDCTIYAEHAKRFTVIINDVLMALKKNGMTLYGYAMVEKRRRITRTIPRQNLAAAAQRVAARSASPSAAAPVNTPRHAPAVQQASQIQFTNACTTTKPVMNPSEERAKDIQTALSYFFLRRSSSDNNTVQTAHEWINGYLLGGNKEQCTEMELDIVLEALKERGAIMTDPDENTGGSRVLYQC